MRLTRDVFKKMAVALNIKNLGVNHQSSKAAEKGALYIDVRSRTFISARN
jgi:hypothetical protein